MSIDALDWAFNLRLDDVSAKATLLALCNHYNPKNGGCWPSVDRLQRQAGLSRRPLQRALRRLEGWGLILNDGQRHGSSAFYEVRVNIWMPSDLLRPDVSAKDRLLFGVSVMRRRFAGVEKIKEELAGGVAGTRGGVVEVTHPWRKDALIIIEPVYNHFDDLENLASEVNDWELEQMGWQRPAHVRPSCVQP